MKLNIKVDTSAALKQLRGLEEKTKAAATMALNKTAKKAQTEINRAIRDEYVVKADEVRNSMQLRQARQGDLQAVIDIFGSKRRRGRSANMIHFLAALQAAGVALKTRGSSLRRSDLKDIGRQLGFKVRKAGGVKTIQGAFLANRGRTVFMREGRARLPIKPVQVIGFSQMFSSKKISQRVMAKVDKDFIEELDRAIKLLLSR